VLNLISLKSEKHHYQKSSNNPKNVFVPFYSKKGRMRITSFFNWNSAGIIFLLFGASLNWARDRESEQGSPYYYFLYHHSLLLRISIIAKHRLRGRAYLLWEVVQENTGPKVKESPIYTEQQNNEDARAWGSNK